MARKLFCEISPLTYRIATARMTCVFSRLIFIIRYVIMTDRPKPRFFARWQEEDVAWP